MQHQPNEEKNPMTFKILNNANSGNNTKRGVSDFDAKSIKSEQPYQTYNKPGQIIGNAHQLNFYP